MVEAVKRHILNMLHLSSRPNLTQPVPRSALLNAIKKLHVGRVSEDGSVEMAEDEEDAGASAPPEPASEIIAFGEPGEPRPLAGWRRSSCRLQVTVGPRGTVSPPVCACVCVPVRWGSLTPLPQSQHPALPSYSWTAEQRRRRMLGMKVCVNQLVTSHIFPALVLT